MNTMTNYDQVREFHQSFGHPHPTSIDCAVLDNENLVNLRMGLINEERDEVDDALSMDVGEPKDNILMRRRMKETIDGLMDLLYVTYGAAVAFGIDANEGFRRVHQSNMSKLCMTEEEAKESVEHYKTLGGFETTEVGYRLSPDGKHYVLFNVANGKILKSKNFKLPNFDDMF